MDKAIKILLTLVHSTNNLGDLALLKVSIQKLTKYIHYSNFTISANYPEEIWYKNNSYKVIPSPITLIGKSYNLPLWLQFIKFVMSIIYTLLYFSRIRFLIPGKWNILLSEYESCDIVIAVPGNQMFSTGRFGWPFPVSLYSIALAHIFRKPVYVLPQSIGPFRRKWEKILMKYVYSKAKLIFLRDQISIITAEKIGLPMDKVIFAPDPALALEPCEKKKARELLSECGWNSEKPSLGVTIIAPIGRFLDRVLLENYYSILANALFRFCSKYNLQVVLFIQVSGPTDIENDRISTLRIYNEIYSKLEVVYIKEAFSPELLKACYGEMNIFLASRLHSGIFSISMGVPTVFIGYLTKTEGVLRSFSLEKYGINLEDLNENLLISRLEEVWLSRAKISSSLRKLTRELLLDVDMSFSYLAHTIYN